MTDLNSASLADFASAGLDSDQAREVGFWRPYRSWDQLLLVAGIDDAALDRLKRQGFEIAAPNDAALAPPKPFKLSVAAQYA
jgi:DNA uptake protein ComE-like DNA-binding protein